MLIPVAAGSGSGAGAGACAGGTAALSVTARPLACRALPSSPERKCFYCA